VTRCAPIRCRVLILWRFRVLSCRLCGKPCASLVHAAFARVKRCYWKALTTMGLSHGAINANFLQGDEWHENPMRNLVESGPDDLGLLGPVGLERLVRSLRLGASPSEFAVSHRIPRERNFYWGKRARRSA